MVSTTIARLSSIMTVLATLGFVGTPAALAQLDRSRCADCHFANPYTEPAQQHLHRWSLSPHQRADVGCDSCHGGNPDTFESLQAHRGVLSSLNPASPVHRTQLPATCGACHAGPYANFQASRHHELLGEGDRRVPTCSTCHGSVDGRLLSPQGLERQCAECHGPDGMEPRPGRAGDARLLLEGIANVRESLEAARRLMERVRDGGRRRSLEAAYLQAEFPVSRGATRRSPLRLRPARRASGDGAGAHRRAVERPGEPLSVTPTCGLARGAFRFSESFVRVERRPGK